MFRNKGSVSFIHGRRAESTSKYDGIGRLLDHFKPKARIRLTLAEIEKETGGLPPSARRFPSWWANNRTPRAPGRHSRIWLSRGYNTREVDLAAGTVTFIKGRKERLKMSMAEMVLEAAWTLTEAGRSPFSRREIAIQITHLHPCLPLKLQAMDPAIQAMVEKSGSGRLVAERWRNTLTRVRRGALKLSGRGRKASREIVTPAPGRGKSLAFHLKEYFKEKEGLLLAKGSLSLGARISVPFDLVSRNRKTAVKILTLKGSGPDPSARGRKWGLFQTLYVLEKAQVKRPILVLQTPARSREGVAAFLHAYRPMLKNIDLYVCTRGRGGAAPDIEKFHRP